jgi:phosphoserine phosphatase
MAWDFVGTYPRSRFGFDRVCGPRLKTIDGPYSGELAEQFDGQAKRDFALRVAPNWMSIGYAAPPLERIAA